MKNIQTNLLSAFEASGLTYDELARRTCLPKSALYRYLNGDTEKIPIDRFQSICAELHVDARVLLGWSDEVPEDTTTYHPKTYQARIMARNIDNMPEDERDKAIALLSVAFSDFFKEEP